MAKAPKKISAWAEATKLLQRQSGTTEEDEDGTTVEPQNTRVAELENIETVKPDNGKTVDMQNSMAVKADNTETGEQNDGKIAKQQEVKTVEPENTETAKDQNTITVSPQSSETIEQQASKTVEPENRIPVENESSDTVELPNGIEEGPQARKKGKLFKGKTGQRKNLKIVELQSDDDEKATEKVTLYLTYAQRDKMDNLAIEYKRRTRRRTDANKLMRIMVDRVSIDDLF